jgi:hypothetical protein
MTKTKNSKASTNRTLTSKDVSSFERIKYQLLQLRKDFTVLAKKPNDPVNKFKLNFVNEKLLEVNALLTAEFKPSESFDQFDEDDMPTTTDVLMILSQYIDALEAWRSANVHLVSDGAYISNWYWMTTDKSSIEADGATRYREY